MSGPLLSRFDLVFILLDKPDEERDFLLSEHVISLHTKNPATASMIEARVSASQETQSQKMSREDREKEKSERSLMARLLDQKSLPAAIPPKYVFAIISSILLSMYKKN